MTLFCVYIYIYNPGDVTAFFNYKKKMYFKSDLILKISDFKMFIKFNENFFQEKIRIFSPKKKSHFSDSEPTNISIHTFSLLCLNFKTKQTNKTHTLDTVSLSQE